jgi:uncharacterized protein (DUF2062 family)
MQGETRYSALLLAGVACLVALGLVGLPVATAILSLFAATAVGVVLYGLGVIVVGHRQAVARRRRRRRAERAAAGTATAPVPVPARIRSPA